MSAMAENDAVFNDLLTEVTDFANHLRFNNTKGLKGEVAAGGSYKQMIQLDASNVVQLGEAGTEVRVPQDPVNALGVATKAYVDGVQMFQTQPKVVANGGGSSAYATILNLTATTRGRVRAIHAQKGNSSNYSLTIRITVDGGTPVVIATVANPALSTFRGLQANLVWSETNQATADRGAFLIDIAFNASLLIEGMTETGGSPPVFTVVYEIIP